MPRKSVRLIQTLLFCGFVFSAPFSRAAITNREIYPKPPLPALGPAGCVFRDPTFGSRLLHVTDAGTLADSGLRAGRFITTPLYGEPNAWNADGSLFYLEGSGALLPFTFDRKRFRANQVEDTVAPDKKLVLRADQDATFSYNDPNSLYVKDRGTILRYDFSNRRFYSVLDLHAVSGASTRYLGPLSISADEKLCLLLGGSGQESSHLILVYDVRKKTRRLLDTSASMIDGKLLPPAHRLGWLAHYAWIDKSGRYAVIMSTGIYQLYVWDLNRQEVRKIEVYGHGRKTLGYGWMINDARPPGDLGPQYLLRSLDEKGINRPQLLMRPSGTHSFLYQSVLNWNHARPDQHIPVLVTTFNDARRPLPPAPFTDEIFALATDGSGQVKRYAHHRSLYKGDWWDMPKGSVSQDGNFYLFTSNWEGTLGPGRRDVFLLELSTESQKPDPVHH